VVISILLHAKLEFLNNVFCLQYAQQLSTE